MFAFCQIWSNHGTYWSIYHRQQSKNATFKTTQPDNIWLSSQIALHSNVLPTRTPQQQLGLAKSPPDLCYLTIGGEGSTSRHSRQTDFCPWLERAWSLARLWCRPGWLLSTGWLTNSNDLIRILVPFWKENVSEIRPNSWADDCCWVSSLQ